MQMTKKRIIYTIVVTFIVVFSSTFAILMTLERNDYRNYLQGEYSKNMYELINSVQNIQVNLGKAAIVGSRDQKITVFEEIFRYASTANDKLASLPIPQETVGNVNKFLSQVGDFCYSLSRASAEGRELTDDEYAAINKLKAQSFELQASLNKVLGNINEGKVRWGEIRKKVTGVLASEGDKLISNQFKGIQKQVSQYPTLIYDGPFSDNQLEIKPKILSQKEVTENDAIEIAKTIVGKDRVDKIERKTSEGKTRIPSYSFNVSIKGRQNKDGKVVCDISKNGGKVLYLLDSRKISKAKVKIDEAIQRGNKYLQSIGYENMLSTYTLNYGDTALICYVFNQQNVVMYPDQIKLKIALDDGSIIGIESEKYLVAHENNRKLPEVKVSAEDAQKKISKRLSINSVKLSVVPTPSNKEVLCYEFSGTYDNDSYIVYINAVTGFEERILQIQNTPNGELTI